MHSFPGSQEWRREQLEQALVSYIPDLAPGYDPDHDWFWIHSTFDDHVVVEVHMDEGGGLFDVDFDRTDNSDDSVTFSFTGFEKIVLAPQVVPGTQSGATEIVTIMALASKKRPDFSAELVLSEERESSLLNHLAKHPTAKFSRLVFADVREAFSGDPDGLANDAAVTRKISITKQQGDTLMSLAKKTILTESQLLAATKPKLEFLQTEELLTIFTQPLLLEASEAVMAKFANGERVSGKAPLLVVAETTATARNYTVDCCKDLLRDLCTVLEGAAEHNGPWPTAAGYATHDQALSENGNPLTDAASRFTGVYIEGGKTSIDDLEKGDVIGVTFDMLSTQAGRDTTAILLETDWIGGLSLRGFKDGKVNEDDGVTYVHRLVIDGFGGDFVTRPAAPFKSGTAVPVMEDTSEDGKGDKPMKLEDLKEKAPKLYAELMEGRTAKERNVELEENQAKANRESAVDALLESFAPQLESFEAIKEEFREEILGQFRPVIEAQVQAAVEANEGLGPETAKFQNIVETALEGPFKAMMARYDKIAAAGATSVMTRGGIPTSAIPKPTAGLGGGDKGGAAIDVVPYFNTLSYDAICLEEDNERVGLPTGRKTVEGRRMAPRITDVLHSMANKNMPVYVQDEGGGGPIHILDLYRPGLRNQIKEMSANYMHEPFLDIGPNSVNDAMLLQDPRYSRFVDAVRNRSKAALMEANEMTTSVTIPTLLPDIRQGVLEKLYAAATYTQIATIVPCESTTYRIDYEDARKADEHVFGVYTQGSGFANTGDAGALSVGDRVYLKITTLTATAGTITINYTNQNSVAKTGTVAVPDGSTVGTIIPFYPDAGDLIIDVTGGSETGWTAGVAQVHGYKAPDANSDQITTPNRARTFMNNLTGTVSDYSLAAELAWRMVEDSNRSLARNGPGRYDVAARTVRNLGKELIDHQDRKGFALMNDSTDFEASNTISFDVTATGIPAGKTEAEHKATLLEEIYGLQAMLYQKSLMEPDWLVVNYGDRKKLLWMTRDVIRNNTNRAEAFFNNQDWGVIAGMQTRVAFHQNHQRLLAGSTDTIFHAVYIPVQFRGPFPFVSGQTTDTYVARARAANITVRPESRGYIEVTE